MVENKRHIFSRFIKLVFRGTPGKAGNLRLDGEEAEVCWFRSRDVVGQVECIFFSLYTEIEAEGDIKGLLFEANRLMVWKPLIHRTIGEMLEILACIAVRGAVSSQPTFLLKIAVDHSKKQDV